MEPTGPTPNDEHLDRLRRRVNRFCEEVIAHIEHVDTMMLRALAGSATMELANRSREDLPPDE